MAGFWQDEEVKAAATGGEYMRFVKVGDAAVGTIAALGKRYFDDRLTIEIKLTDGMTVTAGQYKLVQALFELEPARGEDISIELVHIEKRGAKTHKSFRVEVTGTDGKVRLVDQTPGADDTADEEPEAAEEPAKGRARSSRSKAGAGAKAPF